MFFQPLPAPPAKDEEEECNGVELRRRRDGDARDARPRPLLWSRGQDSLEKIDENQDQGQDQGQASDSRAGYRLSGYLYTVSNKMHLPALKGLGTAPKKRWFVYSDSVCKLYYYKQRNDSEPLGMIDVAVATFLFDPENKNEGQFTIR